MNKIYGFCMLLFMLPFLLVGQQAEADDTAALIDSLSESREQSILAEYGFRDTNTLSQVAQKLEIKNIDSWKSALGLEPANKALNDMTLRRLEISPYRALLGKQTVEYGYNELSTVSEISASLSMPMKKLKAMLGNKDPLDKSWDNRSIQALNISPQRIKDIHDEFTQDVLIYGASVTLVGMLVVFSALLLTSIVIRQLVHLNRAEQSTPVIKLGSEGKLKAAPKNLSRNVIVAAITALHIHQQEIEDKRRMVLTFRRTPTNQWRASAVLSMPNRELNSRR
ncbi:MAG: OadG family protein [Candidatus Cloacimonetes bacterium]|nr:OadG family protein [Candidatus Cloacimonadota bacterium]MDD2544438.1 OadG family protein [Candidatus Cloacimonadota bacterium]MDD2683155.1 OadG family protein [Candidatus Cloacimonadota bacterium]MDD3097705.1 OadG family protein [Candidatus Cloacimonadota bacterium]HPF08722.1 OadG family protein [Candidatus Cloacimonadota bacterium]